VAQTLNSAELGGALALLPFYASGEDGVVREVRFLRALLRLCPRSV
jgi:hypothetical protein